MFLKLKWAAQITLSALCLAFVLPALHVLAVESNPKIDSEAPFSGQREGAPPGEILNQREARKVPDLSAMGPEAAKKQSLVLVDWAASATGKEDELVRRTVAGASDNADLVSALCAHAMQVRETDHSRALVTLALIGEMRSKNGIECLEKIVALELPVEGTVVEGEVLERTALEILQAKAIDGLAYFRDSKTDELVLNAVADHPSRIVRAEAVAAYLWNHGASRGARRQLQKYVRKDEEIFIDRVVRESGEQAESFNPKLEAFLKAHPEVVPPPPEQRKTEQDILSSPPDFGAYREDSEK